jgi:hypothetical protein
VIGFLSRILDLTVSVAAPPFNAAVPRILDVVRRVAASR